MQTSFEQLPKTKAEAIITAGVAEFSTHTYTDASTDRITADSSISKGLLFHYFKTKKQFYLYCLKCALDRLTKTDTAQPVGDFYEILFAGMAQKMQQCAEHPVETKLLNMASREFSQQVKAEKDALFGEYAVQMQAHSEQVLDAAVASLVLKAGDKQLAVQGLKLYTGALINRYLLIYQDRPEQFFARKDTIMQELKAYLDLMLYGICKEKK